MNYKLLLICRSLMLKMRTKECYRLNAYVPSILICGNLTSKVIVLGTFGMRLGYKGGALLNEIAVVQSLSPARPLQPHGL